MLGQPRALFCVVRRVLSTVWTRDMSTASSSDVFSRLPHTSVLKIQGRDSAKFLQGQITQDMQVGRINRIYSTLCLVAPVGTYIYVHIPTVPLSSSLMQTIWNSRDLSRQIVQKSGSGYGVWLNHKGRYLFDGIFSAVSIAAAGDVGAPPAERPPAFLVQCADHAAESMNEHMRKYKLRSKLTVTGRAYSIPLCRPPSACGPPDPPRRGRPRPDVTPEVDVWFVASTEQGRLQAVLDSNQPAGVRV